jgi:hypothetical protein
MLSRFLVIFITLMSFSAFASDESLENFEEAIANHNLEAVQKATANGKNYQLLKSAFQCQSYTALIFLLQNTDFDPSFIVDDQNHISVLHLYAATGDGDILIEINQTPENFSRFDPHMQSAQGLTAVDVAELVSSSLLMGYHNVLAPLIWLIESRINRLSLINYMKSLNSFLKFWNAVVKTHGGPTHGHSGSEESSFTASVTFAENFTLHGEEDDAGEYHNLLELHFYEMDHGILGDHSNF